MNKNIIASMSILTILAGFPAVNFSQDTKQIQEMISMKQTTNTWENVTLNVTTPDVEFMTSEDGTYSYEISGKYQREITADITNSTLVISERPDLPYRLFHFTEYLSGLNNLKIRIYFPKGTQMNSISLKNMTGTTAIDGIQCANLELFSTSGPQFIKNSQVEKLQTTQTSGSMNVENCKIHSGNFKRTSGDMSIQNSEFQQTQMQSTSGKIEFSGILTGSNTMESTSGSITLNLTGNKQNYGLNLETTSGSITLDDEKVRQYHNIKDNQNQLNVKATSGDISIQFKGK